MDQLFVANTHDYILCFSNRGRLYWLKVWEVPQGSRGSRGRPIVNMFPLQEGEKINVVLPLTGEARSFPADQYVFMATSMGTVKKTALDDFNNPRKGGIIAVNLDDGDFLVCASIRKSCTALSRWVDSSTGGCGRRIDRWQTRRDAV